MIDAVGARFLAQHGEVFAEHDRLEALGSDVDPDDRHGALRASS
jgi:hypothetical protein